MVSNTVPKEDEKDIMGHVLGFLESTFFSQDLAGTCSREPSKKRTTRRHSVDGVLSELGKQKRGSFRQIE